MASINCTPGHLSRRNEASCSHKNLYLSQPETRNSPDVLRQVNKLQDIHTTEYYSAIKKNIDTCNNLDESQRNYAEQQKPSQKVNIQIQITFLKSQNQRNGEHISDCHGMRRCSVGRTEMRTATIWQHKGIFGVMECSISRQYQCQYPDYNIVLQFCKMLPLGELGKGSLYYFLHTCE